MTPVDHPVWDDLIGQHEPVNVLRATAVAAADVVTGRAVSAGAMSHAWLFTGPPPVRGVRWPRGRWPPPCSASASAIPAAGCVRAAARCWPAHIPTYGW